MGDRFTEFFKGLAVYLSGDLDLSVTGSPEAVEAMAALLTKRLGLHIVGAVVNEPQNCAVGRVRLKGTLVLPSKLMQELLNLGKIDEDRAI